MELIKSAREGYWVLEKLNVGELAEDILERAEKYLKKGNHDLAHVEITGSLIYLIATVCESCGQAYNMPILEPYWYLNSPVLIDENDREWLGLKEENGNDNF